MDWIDVTVPIRKSMVRWPGDPPVEVDRRLEIGKDSDFNISYLMMSSHTGTHMDAPLHFVPDGLSLDRMPVDATVGPARIIEIRDPESIKPAELEEHDIKQGERVLFKTANSSLAWDEMPFMEDYVHITTESAELLAARKVLTLGVDYLSVAAPGPDAVPVHVTLLEAGIWIIEGLYLGDAPPGACQMVCLPLLVEGIEGAPARVIVRPVG